MLFALSSLSLPAPIRTLAFTLIFSAWTATLPAQETPRQTVSSTVSNQGRTIVVLGDSLAAGNGVDPSEAFPARIQEAIDRRQWPFRVVNAGVSGDTSAGGLRRLDWLLRQPVDVLLLELGGNDGLRGVLPDATQTNLQAIIDRTKQKYPDAKIVIAGMKMPTNMGPEFRDRFEKIFPELAERNNALLVPFLLEGVGGRPELNQPDRIHPTAEGHRIIATNVWQTLEPLLKQLLPSEPPNS